MWHFPILAACSDYDLTVSLITDKSNTVVFDNSKLKKLVPSFTATIRANQGIRSTISYALSHPEYQNDDPEFDAGCDKVAAALTKAVEEINISLYF